MVRCYDCGQPIPDEQIIRRFVRTGASSGRGSSRSYYHRVNLCPACAASRSKTNRICLLVALAIGGSVLMPCLCCGILGIFIPKKGEQTHHMTATVRWIDPGTRQIGLRHGGIPGSFIAGDNRFSLAPAAPWPNVLVGQKVECVMESRNGQWVVSRVNPAQPADALKEMLPKPFEGMPPKDNRKAVVVGVMPMLPKPVEGMPLKPLAKKPFDVIRIDAFLGISADFKAYAVREGRWTTEGVKVVDLKTGKNLVSTKWDRDWGTPFSAAFGNDTIAIVTSHTLSASADAVKIFSRKTGELMQNIHGREMGKVAFTADARFLAFTGESGGGYSLFLRDVQEKKTVAEVLLGHRSRFSLAVAGKHVAVHESNDYRSDDYRITVVEAETGKLVKILNSGSFRKTEGFGGSRMPFAISPKGNLIACGVKDDVVLYNIASGKVAHKLEGHLDTVEAIAFSPNGEVVASAAKDKTIRFWNVKQGKEIHVIQNLPVNPGKLIFSTDGNRIAVVYPELRKAEIRSVELK